MAKLNCKVCNKEFISLLISRESAAQQAMEQLTKHVNMLHKDRFAKMALLIQQGTQLIPAVMFTEEFVEIGVDAHADWIAEQFGAQQTQLAMICGFEFEDDAEGDGGDVVEDLAEPTTEDDNQTHNID